MRLFSYEMSGHVNVNVSVDGKEGVSKCANRKV